MWRQRSRDGVGCPAVVGSWPDHENGLTDEARPYPAVPYPALGSRHPCREFLSQKGREEVRGNARVVSDDGSVGEIFTERPM